MISRTALFIAIAGALLLCACRDRQSDNIVLSGTVEARQVDIRAEVSGKVVEVAVDEGDEVGQGQNIARIDADKLAIQRGVAQHQADNLDAQVRLAIKGPRQEEIEAARQALEGLRAKRRQAADDLARLESLAKTQVVPQADLERAQADLEVLDSQTNQAEQNLRALLKGTRPEQIESLEQSRDAALGQVALIDRSIADATIESPIDGLVISRYVEPGEVVGAGGLMFSIRDPRDRWIVVYVPQSDLGAAAIGKQAVILADAYPGREFSGAVSFVSDQAEFTPKNVQTADERTQRVFRVKIRLDDPEGLLLPGMTADVRLAR